MVAMMILRVFSGLSMAILLVTIVLSWTMGPPLTTGLLIPFLTGVSGGIFAGTFAPIRRWYHADIPKPGSLAVPSFCRDCGSFLVTSTQGAGFDIHTGKPRYSYLRHCSDAKFGSTNWPFCNVKNDGLPILGLHTHTDPAGLHTDCPACIDVLARDGVIPHAKAEELYAAIGAQLGKDANDRLLDLNLSATTYASLLAGRAGAFVPSAMASHTRAPTPPPPK